MAHYIYDKKKKKVVEVTKDRLRTPMGKPGDYINMRKTWSGTTKIEFSETTIDKDIAERNKR